MRRVISTSGSILFAFALSGCSAMMGPRTAPAPEPGLANALDSIFDDSTFVHGHWGVEIRSLQDDEVIYERNSNKVFLPASNMKLITGAIALETLGPDYTYTTTVEAAGPIENGVLQGDLVVRGTGDPTFSIRLAGDPRDIFRAWADSLRVHGITRVAGGIVGIDDAFEDPSLGSGWSWDDLESSYAAGVTGLQFSEAVVDIEVIPGSRVGDPGIIILNPPTQYVQVLNETVTTSAGTPGRIDVDRDAVGPGITISGTVPIGASYIDDAVAIRNPTAFFVSAMREVLRESGIIVEGQAVDADDWPIPLATLHMAVPLFTHRSIPLSEILPAMLKPSQNWIAETLLRTVGLELRGEGSADAGAAVVDSVFANWGLQVGELRMADGSGLSRYNLVSPDLLTGLLEHMTGSANWDLWYSALPIGGLDGTLASRMEGTPAEGNVHAKTGTLSGVRALSGYVTTAAGERMVFSMLLNHHLHSARDVDAVTDAALALIAASGR
ncbi:MAG TPA: D-alanyl-D-alanine carboxypeptidase/D-alanyl-D-alanine-endopeptidase [Longimicrobiaceae bacterium]|nr:D-alanyl-D-alanine carboxypeptidase/D-alanyl-D-alanine-endopeptidase [Longimicrobiaceae bacterium]